MGMSKDKYIRRIAAMAQTRAKKGKYKILGRPDLGLSVAITFKARELPFRWTIFIRKKEWTPEVEKTRILKQIKKLKKELKRVCKEYYAELTKTQYNILWSLAVQGPCSSISELKMRKFGFPIKERIGEETTIDRELRFLESRGLLKIGRPQGVHRRKPCRLTTAGLFTLLAADWPEVWKELDKIILENESRVPLIFGNWKSFNKEVANDFRVNIINYFKHPIHSFISSYEILRHMPTKLSEKLLAEDMTRHVIVPYIFPYFYELFLPSFGKYLSLSPYPSERQVQGWFKTIIRYPNLKEYLLGELNRLEHVSKNLATITKEWKNMVYRLEKEVQSKSRSPNQIFSI